MILMSPMALTIVVDVVMLYAIIVTALLSSRRSAISCCLPTLAGLLNQLEESLLGPVVRIQAEHHQGGHLGELLIDKDCCTG